MDYSDDGSSARVVDEFWRMWLRERDFFLRMCVRWLRGNRHDAEDVLSKGSINALEYMRLHPATVQRFRPWMLRILHNLCIDVMRARARGAVLDQCAPVEATRLLGDGPAPQHPDNAIYRREIASSIVEAASTLPPRLYEVFTMRFIDEMPYDEISRALMISPQNARKRIQQVRELLRVELGTLTR